MGTFRVTIAVGDSQGSHYAPVEALVDTGSTYAALPASFLRRLGVAPHERRLFELADDRRVERDVGRTWVQIDGRTEVVLVVFADEGTQAFLGAVTLEIFGLAVDPVRRRLVAVPGLMMAAQ
jgi:predicted aspartyl protease